MPRLSRDLTAAERAELDAINLAVTQAIAARREWLDRKMAEVSALKVGDEIFNVRTGQKLGVVSGLYRFWRDRDEGVRDTSLGLEYEYQSECGISNTSSQTGVLFGSRQDAARYAESTLRALKAEAR